MTAVHVLALATTSVGIEWICPDVTEKDIMPNLTQVKVSDKWEISTRWLHHVVADSYGETRINECQTDLLQISLRQRLTFDTVLTVPADSATLA